jgi:hypothetical protein
VDTDKNAEWQKICEDSDKAHASGDKKKMLACAKRHAEFREQNGMPARRNIKLEGSC